MKIADTNLTLSSEHASLQHRSVRESVRMWVGNPASDLVTLSDAGRAAQSADAIRDEIEDNVRNDPKLNLLRHIMEALTGEKIRVINADQAFEVKSEEGQTDRTAMNLSQENGSAGYGFEYDYLSSYTEIEETRFSASGTIRTQDGQEINFSLEYSMTRIYQEESRARILAGDAVQKTDPLVISFEGSAAELENTRFAFDLDSNGDDEQINLLRPGNAFLVFDRNHDNLANNGNELFGPETGNGFNELSRLDEDNNGWIDRGDGAFSDLKLWQPNADGNNTLHSLSDFGIGALSLASAYTPFSLKNAQNSLLGEITRTGVFLQEDGKVGRMQQIDLTI